MNKKHSEGEVRFSKNKIIFLDIDGVLNNDAWMAGDRWEMLQAQASSPHTPRAQLWKPYWDFAPKNVILFNEFLDKTDASIVVSSTWRKGKTPKELEEILFNNGNVNVLGRIIGKTEDFYAGHKMSEHVPRWKYIKRWLDENAADNIVFVVIDDDPEAWSQGPYFVWTDPRVGFTVEDSLHALQILNRENP